MRKLDHVALVNYLKDKFIENLPIVIKEKDIIKLGEFLLKFYMELINELRHEISFIEDEVRTMYDYEKLIIELEERCENINIALPKLLNSNIDEPYKRGFNLFFLGYKGFVMNRLNLFTSKQLQAKV